MPELVIISDFILFFSHFFNTSNEYKNSCNNHGQCRVGPEGMFECRCYDGWDGIDCSLPLEKDCKDGKDNDKGSLMNMEKFKEKKRILRAYFEGSDEFLELNVWL